MPAIPYFAPAYFAPAYFAPSYYAADVSPAAAPAALPSAGPLSGTSFPIPPAQTSAVGSTAYWAYFPAPGTYAVSAAGGILTVTPTALPAGPLVVRAPAAGRYRVLVEVLRSGRTAAYLGAPL